MKQAPWERPYLPCVCVCDLNLEPGLLTAASIRSSSCQPSHTQMLSLCSLTIRSHTPWVSGHHFIIPLCLLTLFCCYILTSCRLVCTHLCVQLLLTLAKHWFLFLSAVGSAAHHLYCFPSSGQRAVSQNSLHVGQFPFLLGCFTFPHPLAQMVEPWSCQTEQNWGFAKLFIAM